MNISGILKRILAIACVVGSAAAWADDCANITAYGAVAGSPSYSVRNTGAINAAIAASACVYVPHGVFWIAVSTGGVVVRSGTTIRGTGAESSMLIAADRAPGAMIHRVAPQAKDDYVTGVTVADLGLIMNMAPFNSQNPQMIGIDLSHISGSVVSHVYVGTNPYHTVAAPATASQGWINVPSDFSQGIGILVCTYGSAEPLYSGGERNRIEGARIVGAAIGISLDNRAQGLCSSQSAAHGTVVREAEIGNVEIGIGQESPYTAGVSFRDNTIQDLIAGGGAPNRTLAAFLLAGYAGVIDGGYIEAGGASGARAAVLSSTSVGNRVDLGYASVGGNGQNGSPPPRALASAISIGGCSNLFSAFDMVTHTWVSQQSAACKTAAKATVR